MFKRRFTLVVCAAALLAGCSGITRKDAEVNPTDMPKGPGLLSGESGNLLEAFNKSSRGGNNEAGGKIGVNIYLWRASLESIAFMPITQADSNGGVITTDWYSAPQATNERVRANILILGKSLRADGLKVTLFKQTRDAKGNWSNATVSEATTQALEDAILTKARALRVQTMSSK